MYSICIQRCFPQGQEPKNDCDCKTYAIHRCTEALSFIAKECRAHFNAQCRHKCDRFAEKHFISEREYFMPNQVPEAYTVPKDLSECFGFVSLNGSDQNGTFSQNVDQAKSSPFQTLQQALKKLKELCENKFVNATLYLTPGIYNASETIKNCNFRIKSSSFLQQNNTYKPDVFIVPIIYTPNPCPFSVPFLNLENVSFSVEGINFSNFNNFTISISSATSVDIQNCCFKNNGGSFDFSTKFRFDFKISLYSGQ